MTREEANKELERAFDVLDHTCHMDNRRKEAFNMARVALSAEPCEDCISREEVCDYIAEFVNHEYATDRERELVKNIIDGIQHLPSIQPTTKENLVVGDCISRKALIEYANNLKDGIGITANDIARFPSIQTKTDVLDKIRTEIADLDDADYDYEGYYKAVTDALKIIDKYKAESEGKE